MSDMEAIVRAGVEKRLETLRAMDRDCAELQRKRLLTIVRNCADTEFGRAHEFADIESIEDFRATVPLSTPDDYDLAWKRTAKGERGILFPEPVYAYALSSGTTGEPKTVPVNKALVRGLKRAIGYTVSSYMGRTGNFSLLRGYALQMSAPTEVRKIGDTPVGYITGIMSAARTYPFHNIGIPSNDVLDMMDWGKKNALIEERYADHDVRMIFGIPGYMLALFESMTKARGVADLRAIWPNLELVVTSGTSLQRLRGRFEALCPDSQFVEMYLATEGAFACQPDARSPGMIPMVDDVFLEFVPEECWETNDRPRYSISEVETGRRYVVAVTTPAGLFAYSPGDVVRFESTDPPRLTVEGRYGNVINLAAEKLDGKQADDVLKQAGLACTGFTVCPAEGDMPGHEWVLELAGRAPGDAADLVDRAMRDINPLYRHLREGDTLFAKPVITPVRPGTFASALRRRPGQGKILRIYQHRAVRDELVAQQGL